MSALFKVMLATDAELDKLRFPLLASPKLDGIRAYVRDGVVYSRSNKPIPNKWVQGQFKHLEHLDGELIVGSPTSHTVYRDTVSHVMARDKENFAITFYAFDYVRDLDDRFQNRLVYITKYTGPVIVTLHQEVIHSLDSLLSYEEAMLNHGYEGLILRDPDAPYKMGRSTVKEGYLLKLKRFVDAEAVVIGFEERMHNGNEATVSELGRTKRSSHKAGKSGRGDLGAITARTQMELSSVLGQASLTLSVLPSGHTEIRLSGVLPSTSIFLSELKKRLGIPSSSDGE